MKSLLGCKVKDKVTGFKGIVISEHNYVHGCTRCTVQPEVDKDGKVPDTNTFDFPSLKVLKVAAVEVDNIEPHKRTGGPNKFGDEQR